MKLFFLFAILAAIACEPSKTEFNGGAQAEVYDADGFNQQGFDKDGFDKNGFDKDGFGKDGFDKDGFDKDGFNKDGLDENGLNKDGEDENGEKAKTPTRCEEDSINFEDMKGSPTKTSILNQYQQKYGVSFRLSDGSAPKLLKHYGGVPSDLTEHHGWVCSSCTGRGVDWPYGSGGKINSVRTTDKKRLGNYSISGPNKDRSLIVTYSSPVVEASGTLIDVDSNTEIWTIIAYDTTGSVTARYSVNNGRGDGLGTDWKIRSSKPFVMLEMKFDLRGDGGGFALDLFSPAKICD